MGDVKAVRPRRRQAAVAPRDHVTARIDRIAATLTKKNALRAPSAGARTALERLAADAQAALDRYIVSKCDREVLGLLVAHRDRARAALTALNEKRGRRA